MNRGRDGGGEGTSGPDRKVLRTILMVEDDPDIRIVAGLALERLGSFEVTIAENGVQALELAPVVLPDLILLDVMMPGMSGIETLAALRANPVTQSIPVIFVTAKVHPDEVVEYRSLGSLGVITKPFDPMTFCAQVEAIWRGNGA